MSTFIIACDLKIGDVFIEDYGRSTEKFEVTAAPDVTCDDHDLGNQVRWQGKSLTDGRLVDFLITAKYEHYGPNISVAQ